MAAREFAVILAAAGKSQRFNDPYYNKVNVPLGGRALWMYAADAFSKRDDVGQILMVVSPEDRDSFAEKHAGHLAMLGIQLVSGGAQRADSVRNGLQAVRSDMTMVAIHDAARPSIADVWIDDVFSKAKQTGAAILATQCNATLKRVKGDRSIAETVSRDQIWLAQTPQVFKTEWLRAAYAKHPNASQATDDAALMEAAGYTVHVVEGSPLNIKVTTKADLKFAELAFKALPKKNPFPFA